MSSFIRENFSQCETCAYHEAGHILFAYLCGYNCRHVELINEKNEHDFSSIAIIDYGKDSALAAKFTDPKSDSDYFKTLGIQIQQGKKGRAFYGREILSPQLFHLIKVSQETPARIPQ